MPAFALARIIGAGTDTDPYRADVTGSDFVAFIPSDPATGLPRRPWALARLRTPETATGSGLRVLPADSLDLTMGDLSPARRQAVLAALAERGLDTAWITLATTFRAIVRFVGRHLDAEFRVLGEAID